MKNRLTAFTLIETLIAIAVFCIGILAVFHWASKTIRNQDYAAIQVQSTFLAREWIELLFNMRDANYHKELPWRCIFKAMDITNTIEEDKNPYCEHNLEIWQILKISIWSWADEYIHVEKSELEDNFDDMFGEHQIYFHNWDDSFYYDYTGTDSEATFFARYLVITWVSENWKALPEDKILKVESHVLYKKWDIMWDKVMETFIWEYEF